MEHITYKISVLAAILLGATYRVIKLKSKELTKTGKVLDYIFTFSLSIIFALVLLNPVMAFLSIPVAYEAVVAMFLALSSETVLRGVLSFVEDFNFKKILDDWIMQKYGFKVKEDGEEDGKEENKESV